MSDSQGIIGVKPVMEQAEELLAKLNETLAELRSGQTKIEVSVFGIPVLIGLMRQ